MTTKIVPAAAVLCLLSAGAVAQSVSLSLDLFGKRRHPAPAPLLAAGIPAFAALGGGAAVARLMRRRRGDAAREATAGVEAADHG